MEELGKKRKPTPSQCTTAQQTGEKTLIQSSLHSHTTVYVWIVAYSTIYEDSVWAWWSESRVKTSFTAIKLNGDCCVKGSLIKLLFCCRYCRIRCATTTRENGRSSSTGPWSSTSTAMWVPSFSTSLSLFPFSPSLLARHAFFTIPFGREVATRLLIEMSKKSLAAVSRNFSGESRPK